jgi:hypothetical protein
VIAATTWNAAGCPPRQLAERYYTVTRWSELPRGGPFAALEEPALLASQIREFYRPLRDRAVRC